MEDVNRRSARAVDAHTHCGVWPLPRMAVLSARGATICRDALGSRGREIAEVATSQGDIGIQPGVDDTGIYARGRPAEPSGMRVVTTPHAASAHQWTVMSQ